MKVLVTGGAGFVGSHLADALVADGHDVMIVDDLSTGSTSYLPQQVDFIELSVTSSEMDEVMKDFSPDVVYHLAAQKNVRTSLTNPVFDAEVNIIGSLRVIEAARKCNAKKFIFVSSGGAIYDERAMPACDGSPEHPVAPYGLAKQTIDNYLRYYHEIHNLDYCSLRPANIYGPRQDPKGEAGVIAIFYESMLSGDVPSIFGGEQTRDFVYVADVVAALRIAMTQGSGIYPLGTGVETTVTDLYKMQAAIAASSVEPEHKAYVPGEMMRNAILCSKAVDELGWKPQITLQNGLEQTWEWFLKK